MKGAGGEVLRVFSKRRPVLWQVSDLLRHPEEMGQQMPFQSCLRGEHTGFNSAIMSNDDVLMGFGIYNDPAEGSCP